jgi:hypothetical protein
MADDDIGYGRPPKHSQFSPGRSGNPRGRPPKSPDKLAEAIGKVLDAQVQYKEKGRTKTATRHELRLRQLIQRAVAGDVGAAEALIRERTRAARQSGGPQRVVVTDWLPDHPGQTVGDKMALMVTGGHRQARDGGKAEKESGERDAPGEAPEGPP